MHALANTNDTHQCKVMRRTRAAAASLEGRLAYKGRTLATSLSRRDFSAASQVCAAHRRLLNWPARPDSRQVACRLRFNPFEGQAHSALYQVCFTLYSHAIIKCCADLTRFSPQSHAEGITARDAHG